MQLFKHEIDQKAPRLLPLLCCKHNLSVKKVTDDKTIENLSKNNLIKSNEELLLELKKNLNYPATQIFLAQKRGKIVGIARLNTSKETFSNNKTAILEIKIKNDPAIDKSMINDLLIDEASRYANKRDDIGKIVYNNREISFSKDVSYHKLSSEEEIGELARFTINDRNDDNKPVNEEKFIKTLMDNLDNPLFKVFTVKKSGRIVGHASINVTNDPSMSGYITVKLNFSNKDLDAKEMKTINDGLIRRIEDYAKKLDKGIYALYVCVPQNANDLKKIIGGNGYKREGLEFIRNINVPKNLEKHHNLKSYVVDRNLLPEKMPKELLELLKQRLSHDKAMEKYKGIENKYQEVKKAFPEMVIDTIKDTDYDQLSKLYKDLNGGVKKEPNILKRSMSDALNNPNYIVIGMRERKGGPIIASVSLEKHPDLSEDCRPYLHPENLIVDKNFKGMGLATTMFLAMYKILYDNDCNVKFLADNWRPVINFYRNSLFGFEVGDDTYEKQIKKIDLPKGYHSSKG